jgi:hypothetical protein
MPYGFLAVGFGREADISGWLVIGKLSLRAKSGCLATGRKDQRVGSGFLDTGADEDLLAFVLKFGGGQKLPPNLFLRT